MKKNLLLVCLAAMMLLTGQQANADGWNFATIPSGGMISGEPSETIGWGYSITNDDALYWLVISAISAGSFQFGTPDNSIFDYPILAPLTTVVVPYDGSKGLYQLTWDASAPVGLVNIGTFTLAAELWDSDPFAGGNSIGTADDKYANYSATVVETANTPVSEPITILLIGLGFIGLAGIRRGLGKKK